MAAKQTTKKTAASAEPEVTPTSVWKQRDRTLTLPSGNIARLRRAGFQAFMKTGIIPNSLMVDVQKALDKGQSPEMKVTQEDIEKMPEMLKMVDDIVIFCFIEPKVEAAPHNEEDRDDDTVYVDEVDEEDKMFIFQWATGGTQDVEQFRKESPDLLAAIQASGKLEKKSK